MISVTDASNELSLDRTTAAKKLARWAEQGWLRRVRRGQYIPIPISVANPGSWSEDALLLGDAIWHPCYFTGWTAANLNGLTEQVFMTTVLKTSNRVRANQQQLLNLDFLVSHVTDEKLRWGIDAIWREEKRIKIADPARTVIDVFDDPKLAGGIRSGSDFLSNYLSEHEWQELISYGRMLGNGAVFKRLGYVAETLRFDDARFIDECRSRISAGISMLEPSGPAYGRIASEWGLRVNARIEQADAS